MLGAGHLLGGPGDAGHAGQVAGEVDAYTAPMLREQIRELAAKGEHGLS